MIELKTSGAHMLCGFSDLELFVLEQNPWGDGVMDDTRAIQAAFDKLARQDNALLGKSPLWG